MCPGMLEMLCFYSEHIIRFFTTINVKQVLQVAYFHFMAAHVVLHLCVTIGASVPGSD